MKGQYRYCQRMIGPLTYSLPVIQTDRTQTIGGVDGYEQTGTSKTVSEKDGPFNRISYDYQNRNLNDDDHRHSLATEVVEVRDDIKRGANLDHPDAASVSSFQASTIVGSVSHVGRRGSISTIDGFSGGIPPTLADLYWSQFPPSP